MNRTILFCTFLSFVVPCSVSGQEKLVLPHRSVICLGFSPDGKKLAVSQTDAVRSVFVWDTMSGRLLQHLKGHANGVTVLAWSEDSKTLIAACTRLTRDPYVSQLKYWDVENGKEIKTRDVQNGGANRAISADGSLLLTVSGFPNKVANVWCLDKNKKTTLKEHKFHVKHASFAADGKKVATSDGDVIKIWELPSGKELAAVQPKREKSVQAMAISPDGKKIVYQERFASVEIVDWQTGKDRSIMFFPDATNAFCVSPDSKLLATAPHKKGIDLWSLDSGKRLHRLTAKQPMNIIKQLVFSPDGRSLAAADVRGTVYVWDVPKLKP